MIDIGTSRRMWADLAGMDPGEVTEEMLKMMCSHAVVYLDALENLGYGEDVESGKQSHPARLKLVWDGNSHTYDSWIHPE